MVESVKTLESVLEPYAGQYVYCEEDGCYYRWDPVEGWEEVSQNIETEVAMNMYDINKQIISQLPAISEEKLQEAKKTVREYCTQIKAEYYMLLCRDINYFTVFKMDLKLADETVEDVLVDCANYIGTIKSIELTEDKQAIEIWVCDKEDTYAMYMFAYDQGVIVCG